MNNFTCFLFMNPKTPAVISAPKIIRRQAKNWRKGKKVNYCFQAGAVFSSRIGIKAQKLFRGPYFSCNFLLSSVYFHFYP